MRGLLLVKNEAEKKKALELIGLQRSRGVDLVFLKKGEIAEKEPFFKNNAVLGAVYCREEGILEPLKVTLSMAGRARDRGVRILTRTGVTGFILDRGRVEGVRTAACDIRADTVVIATGAWTRELGHMIGLDIPVFYHRGTALVTAPQPKCINNVVVSGGFLVNGPIRKRAIGLAVAQHRNGSIIIGQATEESSDYSRAVTPEGLEETAENFLRYFPSLEKMDIIRAWAGNTPYTGDNRSVFGFSGRYPNVFIAAGLKGAFSTAPAAGRMAALMIGREKLFPETADLSPDR